jgi:hypothetical protein
MKPKITLLIAVLSLSLLSLGLSILPALASPTPGAQLPWDFDFVIRDANTASLSAGMDAFNNAPTALYYDRDDPWLKQAIYLGRPGMGNCGEELKWVCSIVTTNPMTGRFNDAANYRDPSIHFLRSGYLYYDEEHHSLEILERHASQYFSYQTQARIMNLDVLCQVIGCTVNSAVSLAYDADGYAHAAAVVDSPGDDRLFYFHELEEETGSCADFGGDPSWQCDLIETGPGIAVDPSIAILPPASPRIAYTSPATGTLKYAYQDALHPTCGPKDDWRCITIQDGETAAATGLFPSMASGDAPHIAYYNPGDGLLWWARLVGVGGNCGFDWNGLAFSNIWQCDPIDSVGTGLERMGISLVMDGADPLIAYMDADDADWARLKLAQPARRLGLAAGNCGPQLPFTWYCQALAPADSNLPASAGFDIDMFIYGQSALFIAYLQQDLAGPQDHLYVARQYYLTLLPFLIR